MNKKVVALIIVLLIVLAPVSYVLYGYSKFSDVLNPGKPKGETKYVVLYAGGKFYVLTPSQYREIAGSLPPGTETFNVTLKSYITGSPEVDLNLTLRSLYDRFIIVIGDPSVQECKSNPSLYQGDCHFRTAAVTEISALVSSLFSMNYYLLAKSKGYDNASAKEYAYEQTQLRHDVAYLSFWTKFDIGRGAMGNEKVLTVLLIGPAEGAKCNCVYAPRKGLLVIEGKDDKALRAEIVLIENVIGFQWPNGERPEIVSATG